MPASGLKNNASNISKQINFFNNEQLIVHRFQTEGGGIMNLKKLNTNEKALIGIILILCIVILLSWGRISKGMKEGFEPYLKEQTDK